jgi:fatty acid-binding protein DegV
MTVRIVTDSSCDLPQELADQLLISIVPLKVRFGDDEYVDRETITTDEFWKKCAASAVLPETAAPSPGNFDAEFQKLAAEGATGIVVLNLSADLSGTIQAAQVAARDFAGGIPVRVVDSRTATMGLGLIAIECAKRAQVGASLEDILALAESLIPRMRVFGALDTLDIEITGGLVAEAGKQRTRSKALAHLIGILKENSGKIEQLGILHAQCADIDSFVAMVKEVYSGEVFIGDIGAVIGTHAGQGTIGIAFRVKP